MHYKHVPPRAERHEVNWYRMDRPGIYAPDRPFFSSLVLHPDLVAWLDGNAPGWSFRSDWDYSNAGDDDEGCHLLVGSREQADGFIEVAGAMSATWVAADRARMRHRLVLVAPDGTETEIERAHAIIDPTYHERILRHHLVLDRQPMRAESYRAMRRAQTDVRDALDGTEDEVRIEVDIAPDAFVVPGTRLIHVRTGEPA